MTALPLGRLERVELRAGWPHEAASFTPWLAQTDNLRLLGQTLGLDLEPEGTEINVGPFRADILCRDVTEDEDRLVLIENQLERTDHIHLGQILTYTAGLKASTVIWAAAAFTEEHRAALDWLNEVTHERLHFFGVEVELWRIGASPLAPRFNVVVKPNDWSRTVSRVGRSVQSGEITELGQSRLAYWTAFRQTLDEHPFPQKLERDYARGSIDFPTSRPDVALVVYKANNGPGVFLKLTGRDAERLFGFLQERSAKIEQHVGATLSWEKRRYGGGYTIGFSMSADPSDPTDWPRQHKSLCDTLKRFNEVIEPLLQEYSSSGVAPPALDT